MVDTYIITLLMCSIVLLAIAIALFTYKTVRNEHRIEDMESQIKSINNFRAMQNENNRAVNESINLLNNKLESSVAKFDDEFRKVSNILNKINVSVPGKHAHIEEGKENG